MAAVVGGLILAMAAIPGVGPGGNEPKVHAAVLTDRPNVVLVVTDDQRVHTIGPQRMPNVWSQLRLKGVDFVDASVPTSLCCPSRATILTGLYAHSTRVYSNTLPQGGWTVFHGRGLENRTIAVALHDAGYYTGLVGKYLNGMPMGQIANGYVPPGWDVFRTFASTLDYYDYRLNDGTSYGHEPADYSTDVLARYGENFIRTAPGNRPIFLYLATVGPHRPFTPAPRHVGLWEGRLPSYRPPSVREDVSDKPPWIRAYPRMPQAKIDADLASAQDALMSIDDAVGGLTQALADTGRLHNTLFIYVGDNGLMVGEHHMVTWKNLPYWWATAVPLLMRWDGHIAPDTTDHRLALNVDLATTISKAAGVSMSTQGLNLLGSVRRSGFPLEGARWFPSDSLPRHPAYCGYRTSRWMFAQYATGFRELYDYRKDPQELRNRAHDRAYRDRMLSLLRLAKATCRPVPPDFHW